MPWLRAATYESLGSASPNRIFNTVSMPRWKLLRNCMRLMLAIRVFIRPVYKKSNKNFRAPGLRPVNPWLYPLRCRDVLRYGTSSSRYRSALLDLRSAHPSTSACLFLTRRNCEETEAQEVEGERRRVRAAVGRRAVPGLAAPAPAPVHPGRAYSGTLRVAFGTFPIVVRFAYQSEHHSQTLPCISYKPKPLGCLYEPTSHVRPSLLLKFA